MIKLIKIILTIYISSTLYANSYEITIPIETLKAPLYEEYQKYLKYRDIDEKNIIKYYKYSSSESLKNPYEPIRFFKNISKKNILKRNNYVKVIFKNNRAIKFRTFTKNTYIDNWLDSDGRIIKEYNSENKSIFIQIFHEENFVYGISCNIEYNQKVCYINYSFQKQDDPHDESVRIYPEFPNRLLMQYQYQELIKKKILKVSSKILFEKFLNEEKSFFSNKIEYYKTFKRSNQSIQFIDTITPRENNRYIKVFYQKDKYIKAQWHENNELKKSIIFNEKGQIYKLIDFKSRSIKEYKYGRKDNSIDEIECLYLKGTCSVKERQL